MLILSTIYKIFRNRKAIKMKIIAGKIVQIVYSCVSIVQVYVSFVVRISEIIETTSELIKKTITNVLSSSVRIL